MFFAASGAIIATLALLTKPATGIDVQARKAINLGQADLQDGEITLQPFLLVDHQVQWPVSICCGYRGCHPERLLNLVIDQQEWLQGLSPHPADLPDQGLWLFGPGRQYRCRLCQ